jgi:LmbE family N-acetylglucosaminyl deacetylase
MKVLCVAAHPDDELIWLWPIIQDVEIERHLITVSDNRPGYTNAREALWEVCTMSGIKVECMGYPSEFYRLPIRNAPTTLPMLVSELVLKVQTAILRIQPDFVFTHNPFGEYGHGDHRLVFNIISSYIENIPIIFSDACQWNKCHLSSGEIPPRIQRAYFTNGLERYRVNHSWFDIHSLIYKNHNAWSWGDDHIVPDRLRLYKI